MEIRQEYLSSRVPPFRDTQGHWNRHGPISNYDFLLVIHSNLWPIVYRFRDKRRFSSKIAIFHSVYLTPPLRELPSEFSNGGSAQKTSHAPTRLWKEFDNRLYTIPEWWTDGQMDRQTGGQIWHNNIALCMLTHDKNYILDVTRQEDKGKRSRTEYLPHVEINGTSTKFWKFVKAVMSICWSPTSESDMALTSGRNRSIAVLYRSWDVIDAKWQRTAANQPNGFRRVHVGM